MSLNYKKEYLNFLREQSDYHPKTIKNYDLYLTRFINCCSNVKNPQNITKIDIKKFKKWLDKYTDEHGEKLKNNTKNYHLIALKSWFKYLQDQDINILPPKKIKLKETNSEEITLLNGNEIKRLLQAPTKQKSNSQQQKIRSSRDAAILETIFSSGLKVSDLVQLKRQKLNLSKNKIDLADKNNISPLSHNAKDKLEHYLELRRKFDYDKNPYLFISHDNRTKQQKDKDFSPISDRSIQRLVKKHQRKAGITKTVTPEVIRSCCAAYHLQNGLSTEQVKNILGHSYIVTTKIYQRTRTESLTEIERSFDYPSTLLNVDKPNKN